MSRATKTAIGILALALFGVPLLWLLVTTLKTQPEFTGNPLGLPASPTLDNIKLVLQQTGFLRFLGNSLLVTNASVVLTLGLAAPAAYALSRLRFRGRQAVQLLLLFGLIVPVHITLIPLLKNLQVLRLSDSLFGLQLVYAAFGLAITVFMLKNAFDEIPQELEDAAAIDGAGPLQRLLFVALPMVRPTLAVAAVYNVVINFNEFVFALTLLQSEAKQTLPLGVRTISIGQFGMNTPVLAAAIVLATVPVLGIFLLAQRQIITGLTRGAVKG